MNWIFWGSLVLSLSPLNAAAKNDWQTSYTPSKLDWLANELNASYRVPCQRNGPSDFCIGSFFIAKPPNTIKVVLTLRGSVPLSEYDAEVKVNTEIVKDSSKAYSQAALNVEIVKKDQNK